MATLQKIRTRAGVLIAIVIGIALLAFILGDVLSAGSSVFRKDQMQIGEINGTSIQYPDYQERLSEAERMYKLNSPQAQIDENTRAQLREQTWQQMVNETVMDDVYNDLGLSVSSDEMFDMLQGSNLHPIIQQLFRNPQTGQVDRGAVINFLKNLENGTIDPEQRDYWLYLEKQILKDRIQTKYATMVGKGLYATTNEAKQFINNSAKLVDIDYVALTPDLVDDSDISYEEKDLKAYYEKHKDQYEQKDGRKIEYITYKVEPSKEDDIEAEGWINDIKEDFASSENNIQFVNSNSDERYEDVWYSRDQLSDNIAAWIFDNNAQVNDTYGPYSEDGGYTIAKLLKYEMQPDSIKARHILLQPQSQAEVETLQATADSLKEVIERGGDFATLARQYSKDQGSAANGGDLGWFGRGQMVKPFEDAAFDLNTNEIAVVQSQFGTHIIQTTGRGRESRKAQVAFLRRNVEPSTETYQHTYAQASKFAGENRSQKEFDAAVTAEKLNKKVANIQVNDLTIPGFDNARQLVRSAFETKVGNIVKDNKGSVIFEIGDYFIIAAVVDATEEGIAPFEKVRPTVELAVEREKKLEVLKDRAEKALNNEASLSSVSSEMGVDIQSAEKISFSSFSIPGIGIEPSVVGIANNLEFNEVSQPIKGNNGVYVIKPVAIENNNNQSTETDIQKNLTLNNTVRAYSEAYNAHKNYVEIKDERSKFY